MKIAVVDYGMGNVHSVSKALQHVAPASRVSVTADPEVIRSADRVVVPGQGALPDCMRELDASGAKEAVLKVPHMGWNQVIQTRHHALWKGIPDGARFYFVHSYFPAPLDPSLTAGSCVYGVAFTCAVARDNIFAVQFHPEKSQSAGLQLLSNFIDWRP